MNDDFTKYSPAILLREAAGELQPVSGTPRLDAELLLQQVLKWERHELISRQREEIPTAAAEAFRELIGRRLQHEPIAYIRGFKEFWGLCFEVGPGVLIPRPETELLVERALFYAGRFNRKISILDLGTGSGAIAVALAVELRDRKEGFHITAGDVSLDALDYAQRNIKAHGVEDRVTIRRSDWLEGFGIE